MAPFLHTSAPAADCRMAIAVARFNADITDALLDGALQTLAAHGIPEQQVTIAQVPGAFELPLACARLAATGRYQAVLALGCVIRGDTPHFDFVAGECARGCMQVGLDHDLPVVFGVLTTNTLAQAQLRADRAVLSSSDRGDQDRIEKTAAPSNKGAEAALAALEMISLLEQL